jgi:hypothetical protein
MAKLSFKYDCVICGKKCNTDKLGYSQGMFCLWKYGSHLTDTVTKGNTCSHCLHAITKTIRKIIKDTN